MSPRSALTFGVGDLLRRPGSTRDETREAVLDGLAVTGSAVPEGAPVELRLHLESVNAGIVLTGAAEAPWAGECRRCLRPVAGRVAAPLLEVFEEHPTEGETQPLQGVEIDIMPVARDTVLLELPPAPLCREECAGLCQRCGADLNEEPCTCPSDEVDARWAALDQLRFE